MFRNAWVGLALSALLIGCGAEVEGEPDAGPLHDAALPDAGDSADAAPDDGGATSGVTLSYRGHTETLDQAYFGYEGAGGEITGLYFELYRGDAPGCPSESSPTPYQTMIVSGFEGVEPAAQSDAEGMRVSFFDFEGLFREEVAPASATEVRLELTAHDEAAGTAAATLEVTFDEGSASGSFVATHCESLDGDA